MINSKQHDYTTNLIKSATKPEKQRITITIDKHHLRAIKHEAKKAQTSSSSLIGLAVATYVEAI
jgi:hypothetical protein